MEPAADAQPLACYFSDAFQDQKSQPADMRLFNRLALAQTVRLRVSLQALRDICMDWTHLGDKKKQSGGHRRQSQTKTGNTNQGRRLCPTYVPDGSRRTTPRGERSFIYLNSFCLKKKKKQVGDKSVAVGASPGILSETNICKVVSNNTDSS